MYVEFAREVLAWRKENGAVAFRGCINRALEGRGVVGLTISGGAGMTRIEPPLVCGRRLRHKSACREESGTGAEEGALGEAASIEKR
jgi:hypothetical protein